MKAPFIDFFKVLAIPTFFSLLLTYFLLSFIFRKELIETLQKIDYVAKIDKEMAILLKMSLGGMGFFIILKITGNYFQKRFDFFYISLLPALFILVASKKRISLFKSIDWRTLVFFISLFIVTQSVWNSHFLKTFSKASNPG